MAFSHRLVGTLAMVFREPCGVVLGIAPWNAPIVSLTESMQDKY